jgi:hypothetical protein
MMPNTFSGARGLAVSFSDSGHRRDRIVEKFILASTTLYIVLLYFKSITLVVGGAEGLEYVNLIALSVATCLLATIIKRPPLIGKHSMVALLAAAFLLVALSIVAGSQRADILMEARGVLGSWTTFIVFYGLGRRAHTTRAAMIILSVCAAGNAAIALWGAATGDRLFDATVEVVGFGAFGYDPTTGRSGGIVGENYMGMYTSPVVALGVVWLRSKNTLILGMAMTILGVLGAAVSLSRTSVLAVAATLFCVSLTLSRRNKIQLAVGALLVFVAYQAFSQLFLGAQLERLDERARLDASSRWTSEAFQDDMRYSIWESYAADLVLNSIVGGGPGYLEDRVRQGYFLPHNSFADVSLKYGIPGLLLYTLPMLWLVSQRSRVVRRMSVDPMLCAVIGAGAASIVSMMFLSSPGARHLWIFSGLAIGILGRGCDDLGRR